MDTTEKKKSRDFNIYYLNFSKVYEIAMMTSTIIWTIAVIAILGLVLAVVLYVVAEKFKVEEDPRIEEVEKVMPGANCGGCGFAGCHAFAEAAVKAPNLDKNFCPVGGNAVMQKVASILGYEVMAKVMGVVKTSNAVFPDKHGAGR